jgi:hypothetical protein
MRIFYVAIYVSEISRETRRTHTDGREGRMQLVRVATKDPQSASLLVVHLAGLFGGEQVALQADGEVQVRLPELNGELVKTLKAVESWLEQSGIASAEVSVNEHSFTVEHPQRVETRRASWRSGASAGGVAVDDRDGSREAVGRP